MKFNLKDFLLLLLLIAFIVVSGYWNFYIWRLKHPQAPTWTYFIP